MSSDAGGRPEVKGITGHPPAVCSRVWPRRREKNDDRRLIDKQNGETCSWCVEEERSLSKQVVQLSQRDLAAGWVSFGPKWMTIFCRKYRPIFNHGEVIGMQSYRILSNSAK